MRGYLCVVAVAALLVGAGCSGDDDDSDGDVATACDAAVEYATAVQAAQGASDADLLKMVNCIADFVQACFTCERNMVSGIDGGTITTLAQIDAAMNVLGEEDM